MAGAIGIIGAGGWGTALAKLLCEKGDYDVTLWCHGEETFRQIRSQSENVTYLASIQLPQQLKVTRNLEEGLSGKDLLLFVIPSHWVREVLQGTQKHLAPRTTLVCATKGIEEGSLLTMGEVFLDLYGKKIKEDLAFLSGPSFAEEVGQGLPAAITLAAYKGEVVKGAQGILSTQSFRVYTSLDVIGVQMGGVVKNIIAIAAGISDGLKLGGNARAALMTRGLAEMTRLATRMGADPLTLSGLPGLGDLILTCTGDLSRNRKIGLEIAKGRKIKDILSGMKMVAEGVRNTRPVRELAQKHGVEMPIVEQMCFVLYEGKDPMTAVRDLMQRSLKAELP
jgi:glycerol-3-phosphate dehydrogenase (NAD(P)+)